MSMHAVDRWLCVWVCLGLVSACAAKPSVEAEPSPDSKAAATDTPRLLTLQRDAATRAGIATAKAQRASISRTVHAPAELTLDPDRTAHISPLSEARVERVQAKLGQLVKKGDVLAVLRSIAASDSQAEGSQAEARWELARTELARQTALRAAGIGAERALQEATASERNASAALHAAQDRVAMVGARELRAPMAGTLLTRHASVGEVVRPESLMFTVADLSHVWVVAQVYERDIAAVTLGCKAKLSLEAYPGRMHEGRVSYVASELNHETRTLPVRVELENVDGSLRPGLFGELRIEANEHVDALVIPADAVQRVDGEAWVFVFKGEVTDQVSFEPRVVTLGRASDESVQVIDGLKEGDVIAISGTFSLRGEMLRDSLAGEE
jgi:membrane fusion protein, heavy metal efflux system